MDVNDKKYGVFISYSHEDSDYIAPIVQLIRTMRKDLVFYDKENITPGKPWEPQLLNALAESEIIIVFWCKHAATSAYVKSEYETAIRERKDVLPLLLDDTDLINALSAYQYIDFRFLNFHSRPRGMEEIVTKGLEGIKNSVGNSKIIASILRKTLDEKIPPK